MFSSFSPASWINSRKRITVSYPFEKIISFLSFDVMRAIQYEFQQKNVEIPAGDITNPHKVFLQFFQRRFFISTCCRQ